MLFFAPERSARKIVHSLVYYVITCVVAVVLHASQGWGSACPHVRPSFVQETYHQHRCPQGRTRHCTRRRHRFRARCRPRRLRHRRAAFRCSEGFQGLRQAR
ncbi:DUF4017 family protein [Kitasatospora sp. NBC_01560]|uniref:DUF4017 family protein n=1 Tax=Kitasatospora sp. NBC_01560 TaxID=2975965 RepID=UPI00386CE87A